MGTLRYGNSMYALTVPDDLLAHVKVVATTKLRRGETFTFTWRDADGSGPGRSTLWMQPAIPLLFEFDSAEPTTLDADLLRGLADAANTSAGMVVDAPEHSESGRLQAVAA